MTDTQAGAGFTLELAIDPAQVTKTIDRPVLLDEEPDGDAASATTPEDREAGGSSAPTA